jgi:hypothetical protein
MPGLTNDPNLQLNIEGHSNFTGLTINTNYGGDSSQMFDDFINPAPDEVMEDQVPLS